MPDFRVSGRTVFVNRYDGLRNPSVFNRKFAVAVLGAGHGGLALAGYLAQQGHRVALWNRSPEPLAPVAELGGICLTMPGSTTASPTFQLAIAPCGSGTIKVSPVYAGS